MALPFTLICDPPFLILGFDATQDTLGWSLTAPGFVATRQIAWLEVCDADLRPHVDPVAVLRDKLSARGLESALAFLTSRDIRRHHVSQSVVGKMTASCLATVGLSNGVHVGQQAGAGRAVGTINILAHVSTPLSVSAFVEAISIVAEARTAAILVTARSRPGPLITGTGTDCIVVAAPQGDRRETYAGLHTHLGQALGAAVYEAVSQGATQWSSDVAAGLKPSHPRDDALEESAGRR